MSCFVSKNASSGLVISALAEVVKSQLGGSRCMKCLVYDDGVHSDFFVCSAQLIQHLDIEHPVYNVINNVVQSHHSTYGTCCRSLLVMAALWFQELEQLLQLGFDLMETSRAFQDGLESCINHLTCSSAVKFLNDCLFCSSSQLLGVSESYHDYAEDGGNQKLDFCSSLGSSVDLKIETATNEMGTTTNDMETSTNEMGTVTSKMGISTNEMEAAMSDVGTALASTMADDWFFEEQPFVDNGSNENIDSIHCPGLNLRLAQSAAQMLRHVDHCRDYETNCTASDDSGSDQELLTTKHELEIDDDFEDCFSGINIKENSSDKKLSDKENAMLAVESVDPGGDRHVALTSAEPPSISASCPSDKSVNALDVNYHEMSLVENMSYKTDSSREIETFTPLVHFRNRYSRHSVAMSDSANPKIDSSQQRVTNEGNCLPQSARLLSLVSNYGEEFHTALSRNDTVHGNERTSLLSQGEFSVGKSRDVAVSKAGDCINLPQLNGERLNVKNAEERDKAKCSQFMNSTKASDDSILVWKNTDCVDKKTLHMQRAANYEEMLMAVCEKLSHGADEIMRLVAQMAAQQLVLNSASSSFDVGLIQTCCLDGVSEDRTCFIDGLLLPISTEQTSLISAKESWRALLINGDVMPLFCHQGYKKINKVTVVKNGLSMMPAKNDHWLEQILKVIDQLNIGVLFVKGGVDENLQFECLRRKVVIFKNVPYSSLFALSCCSNGPLNSYIADCTENSVAAGVELRLWETDCIRRRTSGGAQSYVSVRVASSSLPMQTAVLCHPISSVAQVKAEQLLHCARRLASSLKTRKVLVGGGQAEIASALFLENVADDLEKQNGDRHRLSAVYRAMSQGFTRYADIVCRNQTLPTKDIYDDSESKLEAWRAASSLVCILLRCDMEIVSRTLRTASESHELILGCL